MNKKAQQTEGPPADRTVLIMMFLVVIPATLFAFMAIISSTFYYQTTIPKEVNEHLLVGKFLSSDSCFTYYNSLSGEYVPLSIDISNFNEGVLNGCNPPAKDYYAVRLTLVSDKPEKVIKTSNWDIELGPDKKFAPKDVIILYDNNIEIGRGNMIIELQDV